MEVEEDPHRDLPSHSDAKSSENDEPPAPKSPSKSLPRAHRPGASRLPRVGSRETSSSEDTTPPKAKSPREHVPMPKPHGGKRAAAPVPAPEPGNTAGVLPSVHALKPEQSPLPKLARDNPCQAGWSPTQLTTGGLAGVPSPFPGLFNVCGVVHVPITMPVLITLNVPVTLFPFMSALMPVNVCIPVSSSWSLSFLLLPCSRWPVVGCPFLQPRLLALVSGPQPLVGGALSRPLLYSLSTYDCTATSSSTIIVKFADDTVVMGLISDNDERAYLEEIKHLENWCQENNLLLNVSKTKELIVDCSKKQERHYQPVRISGTTVERVDSFRYLGVHISQDMSWSRHTNSLAKKAHQRLYHLRCLRDFRLPSKVLQNFYSCTIESILTGNITVWFGNSTKQDRQALQRVVRSAECITRTELPDLQTIYYKRCQTKARRIVKDPTHPNNRLFSLLRSGRRFRSLKTKTERLKRSFFPQAIRALNQGN
ncbi:hypothetical protein P4O66_002727 [Electrophorus voltai]|uniref:Alkylated DNA repair protein AlkB homologue 8 N-terminal domain-containing protein n=1 Tax=Electrophorus voltai TaxID=2609070 RepID=A0AAD8YWN3_9TELE|nr:hypothetical protein P4O66_002727 [Electrophorus voltai]